MKSRSDVVMRSAMSSACAVRDLALMRAPLNMGSLTSVVVGLHVVAIDRDPGERGVCFLVM